MYSNSCYMLVVGSMSVEMKPIMKFTKYKFV